MRSEVVARQVRAMVDEGCDAFVSCSPENFAYAAGFVVPSQALLRHRHAMAVLTGDGRNAYLGVDMEASTIAAADPETECAVWAEFDNNAMETLADLLCRLGLANARIGIELGYLPAADFTRLSALMPKAEFYPIDQILARLRHIKTSEEIELLRRLSRIADGAIAGAFAAIHPGDTEMDIAAHLTRGVYSAGAQAFEMMIVATGERSQLPNVGPTLRKLDREDVCRVEIFPKIDGYHAGVCRTAVVETPPAHSEDIWKTLVDAKYLILDRVKPGASCRAIYEEFIGVLNKKNLPPIAFAGHGIGLFLHEDPYIGRTPIIGSSNDAVLEAGMVLGFEPLCYRTGHGFGMQNKDMLVVTESGCELLSDVTDTDRLLVVA
jgi:Xaa-Pro aminopeptidase